MEMQIVFERADSSQLNIDSRQKYKDKDSIKDQKNINDKKEKIDENPLIPPYVIISILFAESHEESEFLNQLQIPNMPNQTGFKKNVDYIDKIDLNLLFSKQNQFKHERF